MSVFQLLTLPFFVAVLLVVRRWESLILNAILVNVFAYIWIYMIWNVGRKHFIYCYLLFIIAIGPFTYFGHGQIRAEFIRLRYSEVLVHLFQPLISLTMRCDTIGKTKVPKTVTIAPQVEKLLQSSKLTFTFSR